MRRVVPHLWVALGFGILLIVAGSAVGILKYSTVKSEFDPAVLVQVGITILIGFFLTQQIAMRLSERRGERDLVTDHIKTTMEHLDKVAELLEGDSPTQAALQTPLKRLGADLGLLD